MHFSKCKTNGMGRNRQSDGRPDHFFWARDPLFFWARDPLRNPLIQDSAKVGYCPQPDMTRRVLLQCTTLESLPDPAKGRRSWIKSVQVDVVPRPSAPSAPA